MSERVTWERCPSCAETAAVGWQPVTGDDGAVVGEELVEFDCASGCPVMVSEVRRAFDLGHP